MEFLEPAVCCLDGGQESFVDGLLVRGRNVPVTRPAAWAASEGSTTERGACGSA
ncbi:hypothetical protein OG625_05820 [Streptomyces sp. NBC_01351]|uniref:hypothetical protein n=1 Tax=Streptomyces sp. NBC_01351 TaxID=2903833 RepID=UPI002E32C564|nr:hypothetical protein [Streptomyces sp. NBC_01351]